MAVTFIMEIPGATAEEYEAVMEKIGLAGPNPVLPEGGLFHCAYAIETGWRVIDVWESEEAFGRFFAERLGDALQAAEIEGFEPPRFYPVYNLLVA
ncbi:MAG: hypothetical protein ACRDZ7_13955 [Acidimicrobiia bacterium]